MACNCDSFRRIWILMKSLSRFLRVTQLQCLSVSSVRPSVRPPPLFSISFCLWKFIFKLSKPDIRVLVVPTQTQAAVHLRSMHRREPGPTGQLKCAGAASYRLQREKHLWLHRKSKGWVWWTCHISTFIFL